MERLEGDGLRRERQSGDAGRRADQRGRDENDEMADHGLHRGTSLDGRTIGRLPDRSREERRRFIAGRGNRHAAALNLSPNPCD